jgi:CMP-N,N'-diacetyllegionaminic acid synthase
MIYDKKLLAIVPARGGSKRLPKKNIIDFLGKPLISWTIESALGSKYIDRLIVSTEDNEIASISKKRGAEVPFLRPRQLAEDDATSLDVVCHVIQKLESLGEIYDYVILLQPTSPYRTSAHIDKAVDMLKAKNAFSIISVTQAKHSPLWANKIQKNGDMSRFINKKYLNMRSQDLPIYYQLNGAIYLCKVQNLLRENTFFMKNSFSMLMDYKSSVDIDDKYDYISAISLNKI